MMNDETLTLEAAITIRLPKVPNFIFLVSEGGGTTKFPAKDLTRKQVEEIGKAWTRALLEKAIGPLR